MRKEKDFTPPCPFSLSGTASISWMPWDGSGIDRAYKKTKRKFLVRESNPDLGLERAIS